jgi:hypothetical protein
MSKKDYCVIAEAIRAANVDATSAKRIAESVAAALAREYRGPYSFKRDRFLVACGVAP